MNSKIIEVTHMLEVYNLLDKIDFLKEVAILEYEEWADNKEKDKKNRKS